MTRLLDAGAVLVGKTNLPEFAWAVMGQNPFYGTVHNPVAPGKTTGGSSSGNAAALAADLCDIALGTDTGCSIRLPSACCETVGLKPRWGSIGIDGVFPLCPTLDTLGPMATDGRGRGARLVGAQGRAGARAAARRADGRAPAAAADGRRRPRDRAERPRRGLGGATCSGSARRSSRRGCRSRRRARGPSSTTRRCSRTGRRSRRGRRSTRTCAGRSSRSRQKTTAEEVEQAYRALEEWRRFEPEVDLYVAPCYTQELPAEDADELEVRLRFSEFLRWVNLIGWAGLAIGNLQLIAPHDETALAAGLAWVRG